MIHYQNSFVITARVATEPQVNTFNTATVKRAALVLNDNYGDRKTSALINIECWRKNENAHFLDCVKKGALLTFSGYLKPEEWTSADGKRNSRVVLCCTKIEEPVEEPENTDAE